eukprot:scaffold23607_cov80-Skeletonema_marinoi.AAC.2
MTFNCLLSIMRPTSRHYPTVYSLALIVLMAYCVWQKHELDHLKGTAASEYVNVNQAIAGDNHHQPPATHSTKVSYVTSFWAKVKRASGTTLIEERWRQPC